MAMSTCFSFSVAAMHQRSRFIQELFSLGIRKKVCLLSDFLSDHGSFCLLLWFALAHMRALGVVSDGALLLRGKRRGFFSYARGEVG